MRVVSSNGQHEARAYVETEVPRRRLEPTVEVDRVVIFDPRRTPTLHLDDAPPASGPRNPEQVSPPAPEDEPRIEMPEGLPLTAAQPVYVPPELATRWRAAAKQRGET